MPSAFHIEEITNHQFVTNKKRNSSTYFVPICLCFCYITGVLCSMISLYTPLVYKKILMPVALLVFIVVALICRLRRSGTMLIGISLTALAAAAVLHRPVRIGILQLFNTVYSSAHHTETAYFPIDTEQNIAFCVTLVCCLVSILLICYFAYFTICRPSFFLTAAMAFLCLEAGLYEGLALHPLCFAPILAGMCGTMTYCGVRKYAPGHTAGQHAASGLGAVTAWLTVLVYIVVSGAGLISGYTRSEKDRTRMHNVSRSLSAFDIENIPDSLRQIGTAMGFLKDTQVSKLGRTSKLEYQDKEMITLTFDTLPDSTMYLKGFTGSTYTNNSWERLPADSTAKYTQAIQIIKNYGCAPQNFAYFFQRTLLPETNTFTCTVDIIQRDGRNYQPYVSYSETADYDDDSGCQPSENSGYSWIVSAPQSWVIHDVADAGIYQTDLDADRLVGSEQVQAFLSALGYDNGSFSVESIFPLSDVEQAPETIRGKVLPAVLMDSLLYQDLVQDVYTALPDSKDLEQVYAALPDTLASCQPKTALERYETLCSIREWLSSCAVYDLSPGKTPRTRDFVNFFLLENHKGYCTHFAAAGTVIARYLGIPARYCEGYVMGKDILSEAEVQSDGSASVTLTDRQSHAWCEFYIDGYGWMPFEMTPGYYTAAPVVSTPETPAETATSAETTSAEAVTTVISSNSITAVSAPTASVQPTSSAMDGSRAGASGHALWSGLRTILLILCLAAAAVLLLLLLQQYHTRRRRMVIQNSREPKKAILCSYRYFLRLMRHLGLPYDGGFLTEYAQSAQTLLNKRQLPEDVPACVISAVLAADMSGRPPDPEMAKRCAAAVLSLADKMEQSYSPVQRLYSKYILHLF